MLSACLARSIQSPALPLSEKNIPTIAYSGKGHQWAGTSMQNFAKVIMHECIHESAELASDCEPTELFSDFQSTQVNRIEAESNL